MGKIQVGLWENVKEIVITIVSVGLGCIVFSAKNIIRQSLVAQDQVLRNTTIAIGVQGLIIFLVAIMPLRQVCRLAQVNAMVTGNVQVHCAASSAPMARLFLDVMAPVPGTIGIIVMFQAGIPTPGVLGVRGIPADQLVAQDLGRESDRVMVLTAVVLVSDNILLVAIAHAVIILISQ